MAVMKKFFVPQCSNSKMVVLSMDRLNFVHGKNRVNEMCFLLYTGVSISVIFKSNLNKNQYITKNDTIKISRIVNSATTVGIAEVSFSLDSSRIKYMFHVVNKNDHEMHGILSSDFLI